MIITGVAKHRRQNRVLEPVRKMLGLDEQAEGAFGSEGIWRMACPHRRGDRTRWSELEKSLPNSYTFGRE